MTDTGVLDTSAVIALSRLTSSAGLPPHPVTTTITFAELAAGPLVAKDDRERTETRRSAAG